MEDLLKRVSYWSDCCLQPIIDKEETQELICSKCNKPCNESYTEEIDLSVLDSNDKIIFITRLEYDSLEHDTIEEFIEDFLLFKYRSIYNLKYMYSQLWPIRIYNEIEKVKQEKN